uniref:Uncharacterized protein n=1 Tax=Sphaerodactylus townsendi TaxID=933632 RepID=A0ACB8FE06_9SAUR
MAYAYLFKYIIIGDTGEGPAVEAFAAEMGARPEEPSRLRNAQVGLPHFRSVGCADVVPGQLVDKWIDTSI